MTAANANRRDPVVLIQDAIRIAREIQAGSLELYEGSRRIWRECQLYLPSVDHRLDPFTYWASEYEETTDVERKALCEHALRAALSDLLERGSAL